MSENLTPENPKYQEYASYMPDYSYVDPYANRVGFGRRLVAYIIDNLILMLLTLFLMLLTGALNELMEVAGRGMFNIVEIMELSAKFTLPITLLHIVYYLTEIFWGFSLGKIAMSVKIGSDSQTLASTLKLTKRYLFKHSSSIISVFVAITSIMMLGFLSSLASIIIIVGCFFVLGQRKQALHDMLAGTAVFYKEDLKYNG